MFPEAKEDRRNEAARALFQRAYVRHMKGQLEEAILLYKESIETLPTAEAYTFLGWAYRFQGRMEEAIEECKNAILIDPSLGNPYNDIGAYLIDLGKPGEALFWLEKATTSRRYATYHYAWFNLGRAYAELTDWKRALASFEKAAELEPGYRPAREAAAKIRRIMQ